MADAAVWITGTGPDKKLNFRLPTGAKGDKGDKGDKGADGANVLPTDIAMRNAIENESSATRGALNAAFGANFEQARVDRLGASKLLQSQARAAKAKADGALAPSLTTNLTANGQAAILKLPSFFDRSVPIPLVIHLQGYGNTATVSGQWAPMATAATDAGFAFVTCDFHGNGYGSPTVLADLKAVFDAVLNVIAVNGVVLSGESMGGIGVLNALTHATLPNVLGAYLSQPIVSLKQRFDMNPSPQRDAIIAGYGIASDGSDYATKAAGYDPNLEPGNKFNGVPIYITGSPNDSSALVNPYMNDLMARLAPYSPVTWKAATGGHGDPSMFNATEYVNFLNKVADGLPAETPPYDFTKDAELLAHFNAATLGLADGAAVTSWAPTGGLRTQPLAQATAANQPVYVAADAGIGGKPAVHMNAVDKRLRTDAWSVTEPTPITVITVAQFDILNNGPLWTGRTGVYVNGSTTGSAFGIGAGAVNQLAQNTTGGQTWRVVVAVYNGPSSRIHMTGAATKTGTTSTTAENANAAVPGFGLNTSSDGTGTGAVRKFARFAALGRALTTEETQDVITQLSAEYGIAG